MAAWVEQLKALLDLQKIDSRVYLLERELDGKPREKKALEDAFTARQNFAKASEQKLKELQMAQKERENELLTKETNIKKYQTQQTQVKTNKEYSSLTREIGGLKADCELFEEEILKLMDEIEQRKKVVEDDRRRLAEEEKKFKAEAVKCDARAEAIRAETATLTTERRVFLPLVEKALVAQYEKILKKREGTAVVPVVNESCGGCHMTMTPQTVNEIRIGEKMIVCESCGRILYENAPTSA